MAVGRGRQPKGGGAGSRTREAGEVREGTSRWPGSQVGPRLPTREGEKERESADRWVWAARGPSFKWIQK
jgi:hypothetical protein